MKKKKKKKKKPIGKQTSELRTNKILEIDQKKMFCVGYHSISSSFFTLPQIHSEWTSADINRSNVLRRIVMCCIHQFVSLCVRGRFTVVKFFNMFLVINDVLFFSFNMWEELVVGIRLYVCVCVCIAGIDHFNCVFHIYILIQLKEFQINNNWVIRSISEAKNHIIIFVLFACISAHITI